MKPKIIIVAILLVLPAFAKCQITTDINKTDQQGRKQGHWIKKLSNDKIIYDGNFKDGYPVGEFKRYYENNTLRSLLIFSADSKEADATMYHSNGNISASGKYVNEMKEGRWKFYSEYVNGYLIAEDNYLANIRNGISLKFYPDSVIAEKGNYINNQKKGEWLKYYPNGAICVKMNYINDNLNGRFEAWHENGQLQFSGQYKNNARDGIWFIYHDDGTLRYRLEYSNGVTNDRQMDIDESDYLDKLEKNKGNISDPEKTGVKW